MGAAAQPLRLNPVKVTPKGAVPQQALLQLQRWETSTPRSRSPPLPSPSTEPAHLPAPPGSGT